MTKFIAFLDVIGYPVLPRLLDAKHKDSNIRWHPQREGCHCSVFLHSLARLSFQVQLVLKRPLCPPNQLRSPLCYLPSLLVLMTYVLGIQNQDLLSNSHLATFWLIYLNLCYAVSEWKWKISTNPRNELKEDNVEHTGNFKLAYASEMSHISTLSQQRSHTARVHSLSIWTNLKPWEEWDPPPSQFIFLSILSYRVGTGPPAQSECHLVDTELCEKRLWQVQVGLWNPSKC